MRAIAVKGTNMKHPSVLKLLRLLTSGWLGFSSLDLSLQEQVPMQVVEHREAGAVVLVMPVQSRGANGEAFLVEKVCHRIEEADHLRISQDNTC